MQHHLERRPQRLHHKLDHQLIKSGPRLDGVMGAPDYAPDYDSEDYDEADYARDTIQWDFALGSDKRLKCRK